MRIPVKFLISVIGALSMALVASITLAIALATGLEALRSLGSSHAAILRTVALHQTTNMFEEQTQVHMEVQNATLRYGSTLGQPTTGSGGLLSPTGGPATSHFDFLLLGAMLRIRAHTTSMQIYFADNTRVAAAATDNFYIRRNQYPSSLSDFPNQTLTMDFAAFRIDTHEEVPTTSTALEANAELRHHRKSNYTIRIREEESEKEDFWTLLEQATGGGQRSLAVPLVVAESFVNGETQRVLITSFISPLYLAAPNSLPRNRSEVYAYLVSSHPFHLIDQFLRGLSATANTATFVYDANFLLLGSSEPLPTSFESDVMRPGCVQPNIEFVGFDATILCRRSLRDYGHAALRAFAALGDLELVLPVEPVGKRFADLGAGVGAFYIASAPVPMAFPGLPLSMVLLMPETDVIGDVVNGRNIAIVIVCALVVLFAGINLIVVWAVLHPLDAIAIRMVKAARLEDDEDRTSLSVMEEVQKLQLAYFEMNEELRRIRSYVPQAVLYANRTGDSSMASGDDDDDEAEEEAVDRDVGGGGGGEEERVWAAGGSRSDSSEAAAAVQEQESDARSKTPNYETSLSSLDTASGDGTEAAARSSSGRLELSGSRSRHRSGKSMGLSNAQNETNATSQQQQQQQHGDGTGPRGPNGGLRRGGGNNVSASHHHLTTAAALETLRRANVTVIAANVQGFHAYLAAVGMRQSVDALCGIIRVAEEATGSRNGVMTFHGDRIFSTFNASRACSGHGRRGVEAALAIGAAASTPLRVRCGVATGPCTVGSFGTQQIKAFSTLGPTFSQAVALEARARQYGVGCRVLATQRSTMEAHGRCGARYIDLVCLRKGPSDDLSPTLVASLTPQAARTADSNDEWLYVVGRPAEGATSDAANAWVLRHQVLEKLAAAGSVAKALVAQVRTDCAETDGAAREAVGFAAWGPVTDHLDAILSKLDAAADDDAATTLRPEELWRLCST